MLASPGRKSKIQLSDYNYRQDISNRLLMAQLSVFEVEVLDEILTHSLCFPISDLVEALEEPQQEIITALEKLLHVGLLIHDGKEITVDKEKRKYYEFQIQKFDDDFAPNLEFVLRGLKRVPIHVLPNWYSIPRASDDIIASIIEKYLANPCVYRRHMAELDFDDSIPRGILEDVLGSPDFVVRSKDLREKYQLSREQFEEYMLLLEFNLVCFLSYRQIGDQWKEVVTPLHEWREYLRFQRDTQPIALPEEKIKDRCIGENFAFIQDLCQVLSAAQETPIPSSVQDAATLDDQAVNTWLRSPKIAFKDRAGYLVRLVNRLRHLNLLETVGSNYQASDLANSWLQKQAPNQAMELARLDFCPESHSEIDTSLLTERNVRCVEKSLRRVVNQGWVEFTCFMNGMIEPIGTAEPVTLQRKGKRWAFVLPEYSQSENAFAKAVIFERLLELGVVSTATYEGRPCFKITAIGCLAIGDDMPSLCQ